MIALSLKKTNVIRMMNLTGEAMRTVSVPYSQSLKTRLITFFILLVTIPTLTIGIFSYAVSNQAIEEKVSNFTHQIVVQTANNLEQLLNGVEDVSLQLVAMDEISLLWSRLEATEDSAETDEEMVRLQERIRSVIDNLIASRTDIIGVNILYRDETTALVYGEPLIDLKSFSTDPVYLAALGAGRAPIWSSTYRNPNTIATYTHISTLARRIIDSQSGRVIGVMLIGIKEFAMADTFSYLDLGPSGTTFIIDSEGRIVSDLNKRRLETIANEPYIREILGNNGPERTFSSSVSGDKILVSYETLPSTSWYLVSVVPFNYLVSEIRANSWLTIQVALGFIVVAVLLGLMVSWSIFRPIETLHRNMEAIEKGDLTVRTAPVGNNEITHLAHSFNRMAERIDYLINQVYEFRLMKQESEIRALHAQINPHFLYNTLTLIDGVALENGQKEIADIVQILADIFRYSTSGDDFATIDEELYHVSRYLTIQTLRSGGKFHYEIQADDDIRDCIVPKLLLQPIVENSIKHGLDKKLENSNLLIIAKSEGADGIRITIRDNGAGMDEQQIVQIREALAEADLKDYWSDADNSHIGIRNVHSRIRNCFGDAWGLSVNSIDGIGSEFVLRIGRKPREVAS